MSGYRLDKVVVSGRSSVVSEARIFLPWASAASPRSGNIVYRESEKLHDMFNVADILLLPNVYKREREKEERAKSCIGQMTKKLTRLQFPPFPRIDPGPPNRCALHISFSSLWPLRCFINTIDTAASNYFIWKDYALVFIISPVSGKCKTCGKRLRYNAKANHSLGFFAAR